MRVSWLSALGFCLLTSSLWAQSAPTAKSAFPDGDGRHSTSSHGKQPLPVVTRGFMGFPAGGIGGFTGAHPQGIRPLGMPGRTPFITREPVTLPNLGQDGRLHPYKMPPQGIEGEFLPGGMPWLGGYARLNPVHMPDVFSTTGVRMGGTLTGDGQAASIADREHPGGAYDTGHLRTDPGVVPDPESMDPYELTATEHFPQQYHNDRSSNNSSQPMTSSMVFPDSREFADHTPSYHERVPNNLPHANNLVMPSDLAPHHSMQPDQPQTAPFGEPQAVPQYELNPTRPRAKTHSPAFHTPLPGAPAVTMERMPHRNQGILALSLYAVSGQNEQPLHAPGTQQAVSRWMGEHPIFSAAWCDQHTWAWLPSDIQPEDWSARIWTAPTWPELTRHLNSDATPLDYGRRLLFSNGKTLLDAHVTATLEDHVVQARTTIETANDLPQVAAGNWLPLGIFSLAPLGAQEPDRIFQLAVNSHGVLRGNSYEPGTNELKEIRGAVNLSTQQVVWTTGSRETSIVETGLSNLSSNTAPTWLLPDTQTAFPCLLIRISAAPATLP
jgi:hypothetical protein